MVVMEEEKKEKEDKNIRVKHKKAIGTYVHIVKKEEKNII